MSNPFATRYTRPGAIDYVFPTGQSLATLVEQLRQQNWNGQFIGPHGSGKSTLLAALVPALEAAERKLVQRQMRGQRTEDRGQGSEVMDQGSEMISEESLNPSTLVIIDGFEQLLWLSRRKIKDVCRRQGAGLLVTAHRDVGLPTLFRTEPSLELARAVVARLMPAGDATITPDDVARTFEAAGGDIRETLFALYDVYQQRHAR